MKKRVALLAGSLALCLAGLAMIVHVRKTDASAAPPRGKIQGEVNAMDANTRLLDKRENCTVANTTHGTEKGKLDSGATIALAKYLMEGRSDRSKQMVSLQEQLLDLAEKMDFAQRKMRD